MTSPVVVGSVAVELVAEARALAKSVRKELEQAFRGLDLSKQVRDAVGTVRIPVDVDATDLAGRLRGQRIPVELDPDTAGFNARVREALRNRKVTVDVDVDRSVASRLGSLFKGLGNALPNIGGLASGVSSLGGAFQSLASSAVSAGGSIAGALSAAAGPIGTIVSLLGGIGAVAGIAFAAIAGGAIFAIPAVTALAGAIAAVPAALSGIGAGVGTLLLGFKGISEAFKPAAGGGGGGAGNQAAQQARQVAAASRQVEAARRGIAAANRAVEASERSLAAAERGVAAAQQNLVDAQERVTAAEKRAALAAAAISRARREAVEDIEDLNRSLRGAVLSEEDAALAVEEALRSLNEVKLTGNIPDIKRADLAYRQALQTLDEAKDTTADLTEATDDANRKGVDGSDKVQSALQDQADALDGVAQAQQGVLEAQNGIIDATDALASAQDGVVSALDGVKSAADGLKSAQDSLAASQEKVAVGAGGVAKEVTKLAPAAQKFVNAIKALKPAFEDLRLGVQQKLFEGLDKTVTNLGRAWIPALKVTLGNFATTFNGFFKNLGASISTPKFISDIQAGAEGFRQLFEKLGGSITDKLVPAFGALSRAAGPFLSKLGDELANVVTQFSNWILEGEKSGGLERFFDKASQAMHDIFAIGGSVASIIGSIFEIITGSSPGANDKTNPLEKFRDGLDKIAKWLKDPENQEKVRAFIEDIKAALDRAIVAANKAAQVFSGLEAAFGGKKSKDLGATLLAGILAGMSGVVLAQGSLLLSIGKSIVTGIGDGVVLTGHYLWDQFKDGVRTFVADVKSFFGISSPSTLFAQIGRDIVLGLIQGMKGVTTTLGQTASTIKTTVVNGVVGAGTWLYNKGQEVAGGVIGGLKSQFGNVGITAGNLRPTIQAPLAKSANTLLYGIGQAVGYGLARGIDSTGAYLAQRAAAVASNVAATMARALAVRSPSRVTMEIGRMVGEGLALGIDDQAGTVSAAADRLAALAVPGVDAAAFGAGLDASLSSALQVADQKTLQAAWKPSATGDQILDALAGLIDLKFNGDVQAALSRP